MSKKLQQIGKEWLNNLPTNWKMDRLKDVCDGVVGGGTPKSSISSYWENGDIVWLSPTDFSKQSKNKFIKSSMRKITKIGLQKSSATLIPKGTVVMSSRASIGEAKITDCKLTTNQGFVSYIPSFKLDSTYLYYIINSHLGNYFSIIASGTTFMEISRRQAKMEYIPLPLIEEQKFISKYLDKTCKKIDRTLELKEKQIVEINDYFYSTIHEVVTKGLDKTVKLKSTNIECIGDIPEHWDIAKIKQKYTVIPSSVNKKSKDNETEVQLCNYTDVYYNDYITNDINFMIATAKDNECVKFKLCIDDVIITKDSEDPSDIAVPSLVKEIQDNLLCGYHLSMIRAKLNNVSGRYLFWLLKDNAIVSQLHREATGITRWAISQRNIKNTIIPNPPVDEQIEIANYLEKLSSKVNKVQDNLKSQIQILKDYRKSLIHECVTGKKQIYKGDEV